MISLPSKPKIVEKKEDRKAVFEIDSLYPGYGVTMGNSLRRVLLSSLSGVAITKVKINEVNHEFSTIEGVMEDVITIILNLKEMRFRMHSLEPQVAKLEAKGEKEVTGADFKTPTQVEVVNPEKHIATITDKKTSLSMEVEIEKGMGYSSTEDRKDEKLEVGQILVDSVFTPVKRANFNVENMRVGKRTDFDRLFIDIETDGTITPEEALYQAIDILAGQFSALSPSKESSSKKEKKTEKKEDKKEKDEKDSKDESNEDIETLKISKRTINVLEGNKIKKIKDILKKTEEEISSLEGMGKKGVDEIKKALKKKKLELKEEK